MTYAGEEPKEYYVETRRIKCHICNKGIERGEKFTWVCPNTRAYLNICDKCLVKLGKLGESMLKDNADYLAMPKAERLKRFKCLMALKSEPA